MGVRSTQIAFNIGFNIKFNIKFNIAAVQQRIATACERVGRNPDTVTLIAVSKTQPPELMVAAYQAGIRHFGENYVQEALSKVGRPPLDWQDVHWHFIGHLQRNKARDIFPAGNDARFTLIQSVDSVDSLALAEELDRRAVRSGKKLPVLLEVKLDPAPAKFGFAPETLLAEVARVQALEGLQRQGLMGMAPFATDPEASRPFFRQLHGLFIQLGDLVGSQIQSLSMGMTGDFETAIEEGATHVRIGTAIFGPRV